MGGEVMKWIKIDEVKLGTLVVEPDLSIGERVSAF